MTQIPLGQLLFSCSWNRSSLEYIRKVAHAMEGNLSLSCHLVSEKPEEILWTSSMSFIVVPTHHLSNSPGKDRDSLNVFLSRKGAFPATYYCNVWFNKTPYLSNMG